MATVTFTASAVASVDDSTWGGADEPKHLAGNIYVAGDGQVVHVNGSEAFVLTTAAYMST